MNLQSLWIASRPKTLIVSIAPVLLGLALSLNKEVFSSTLVALLTLFASIFIQLGTNYINDLYDISLVFNLRMYKYILIKSLGRDYGNRY